MIGANLPPFPSTDWLRARVEAGPEALALIMGDQRWRYGELDRLVNGLCLWLAGRDLPANRRLGVFMPNSLGTVCLVHAAARLGLVLVPFNTRLTAAELVWQIEQTGCELFLIDRPSAISREIEAWPGRQIQVVALPPLTPADELPASLPNAANSLDALQAIVFTSGTSGRPKAVPITFGQHFFSAMGSAYRLGVRPDDLWLSVLPLYHVGGLAVLFRSCLYGTAVDLHARFDLEAINHSLDSHPITLVSLVPTMLHRLLESRRGWPLTLRLVLMGGAATSAELAAAAANRGISLAVSYGMTEAASQIATLMPAGVQRKPGCVGRPLLFTRIKIMTDGGLPAGAGEYGEIWVQGPTITSGYLDHPAANRARFRDGWFATGDIGYFDDEGDLWLVQRRSDLIISGGENIYPAEVEEVLRAHPAVREVCVVGVPDAEWGQRVAAMVVVEPGQSLTAETLLAFGREKLAGYKLPRLVRFVEQLPQTASGKIARGEVVEKIRE